jgi:gliding motility-associated-like protein
LHVEGLDYNWGCTNATNHPGWVFKAWTLFGNQILESGESWSANVYDSPVGSDCWAEILSNDTLCTEIVVWQINLSQTATTDMGGWAVNPNLNNQTQTYPDIDLSNNTAIYCAPPSCDTVYVDVEVVETDTLEIIVYETDTVVEYITDTIELIEYVDVIEYVYDTIVLVETDTIVIPDTITSYILDTLWLTEWEYDTTYIYLPSDTVVLLDTIYEYDLDTIYVDIVVYEYIYETDTITEYQILTTYIDCVTGEPCDSGFPCEETSIYVPNAVTPNGDGWNDTWHVVADGECWDTWDIKIYNRWGGLVWVSASPLSEWDANVATGVYVYMITVHSSLNADVQQITGHITVLY